MDATLTTTGSAAARGRWALAVVFLVNGFLTGSWAPQIPVFVARLGISEFTLGLLILLFGLGAVGAMSVTGYLISRFGSRDVTRGLSVVASFTLLFVSVAPNVPLAAVAMVLFGGLIGGMDVAMNANAVVVERKLSRAIMSSSHGFWSLGGFIGGGLGGLFIQQFGPVLHGVAVTIVAIAAVVFAIGRLVGEERPEKHEHKSFSLPRNPAIYLIGMMALFSMVPEGAVLDWAALYLRQEMGADIATAGFAFAAFSGIMAIMRFLGDGVRNRFGSVRTLRLSALVAAIGIFAASIATTPWMAIAAFAFAGFGVANIVPILFSAAGNQTGLSSGAGMSVVTTMGYSGILVAPSAIGFVAQRTGFSIVFMTVSCLLLVVCVMAGLAHRAEFASGTPKE